MKLRHLLPVLVAVAVASATGSAAAAPVGTSWSTLPTTWSPTTTSLAVNDVWSAGHRAWTVGTEYTTSGATVAVVQDCSGNRCTRRVLPPDTPGENDTVESISGTSATDIWAVGAYADTDGYRAAAWHFDGTRWSAMSPRIIDTVELFDIVTPTSSQSWALGLNNYGDGDTISVYHRVGASWTEVSTVDHPAFPGPCADWYDNSFTDLTVVAGSVVLVGSCDGTSVVLKQDGTGWRDLERGLPAGTYWSNAATISSQVWITGYSAAGPVVVYRRDAGTWRAVPTAGLPAAAYLADLAGTTTSAVWLVGDTDRNSGTGRPVGWRFTGSSWTAIPVPSNSVVLLSVSVSGAGAAFAAGLDRSRPAADSGVGLRAS